MHACARACMCVHACICLYTRVVESHEMAWITFKKRFNKYLIYYNITNVWKIKPRMPATLTGFCPEECLVSTVYTYSVGITKVVCNPCCTGTVPQPRLVDLVRLAKGVEQPTADG